MPKGHFTKIASALLAVGLWTLAAAQIDTSAEGTHSRQPPSNVQEIAFGVTPLNERFSQLQQSVAALAGGGFAAVWVEGNFPSRDVRLQMLTADGSFILGPGGLTIGGSPEDESHAVVVAHAWSGAFVAFQRALPTGGSQVIVQYFDATGTPQWPGDGVAAADQTMPASQVEPYLVANRQGGVFVCFRDFVGAIPPDDKVRCQAIDASGNRLWSAFGEDAGGVAGLRVVPRGVSDGQDGLLVFWRNQRDPFSDPIDPMLMEGQYFAADGTKLWGSQGLVVRTTNLQEANGWSFRFFNVVPDGNGGAILAFNDWTGVSDPMLDVLAQRVMGDGSLPWGQGIVVVGADGQQQHEATIAAPDGGAFVAVYEDVSSTHSKLWL